MKYLILILVLVVAPLRAEKPKSGDTYNFYFTKDKKKKKATVQEPQETEEDAEEEAPRPSRKAKDEASYGDEDSTPVANGSQPIVIHNHNTIQNPPQVSTPTQLPPIPEPTPLVLPPKVDLSGDYVSRMRLGLTGMFIPKIEHSYYVYDYKDYSSSGYRYDSSSGVGGMVSLAGVHRRFGLNTYLAYFLTNNSRAHVKLGGELEFYPISATENDFLSPIELGVLAGSSLNFNLDHFIDLYAGVRANFNFSQSLGLTAVGRVSGGWQMIEVGFITRL